MKRDINTRQRRGWELFLCLSGVAVGCLLAWTMASAKSFDSAKSGDAARVVVVDPGHGGKDKGVKGPEGQLEKNVCRALAGKLEDLLADRYRVVLTRTGDYDVSAAQRVSRANHENGGLFVSLHAGGAFRRSVSQWSIYCLRPGGNEEPEGDRASDDRGPISWNSLQQRHAGASALLARKMRDCLSRAPIRADPQIVEAPAAVLRGVDMPAILVEYGYLTHPKTAAAFSRDTYLEAVAGALANGITDFFQHGQGD
ncbi:MAG: N-acetylmuramoyl-L-alanine amidase [Desulfobacterales bacterium]|nr:N-acetylmuramoyl-L-alanine amidase [Desulfobacterales bacterium]MBS3755664.1 N-acetylmuramoyl-L-alanine amidase [Desulfobacterales bacterium]